ncbi:MAG: glycosyltransferase family 2 protein [Zetaproteobacteria bacterium]|nr:MAG: glycosyltransferase family 2 protein [Zetaproteobacteria bacterium]
MQTCSVIIPTFNEEATILRLLERVARTRPEETTLEVIVVDDCSTDRTEQLLRERPELYHRYIRLERNQGKGGAVIAGLRAASGDIILFQDADLEYDPADYPRLLAPFRAFGADVVLGSRLSAPPCTRVFYFWHKVGNRCITLLFNLLNNTTFTDIYSCYLAFRRPLIDPDELRSRGWEQQAEILSLLARRAERLYEVPISYHGRSYEEGKKIKPHHVFGVVGAIIRYRMTAAGRRRNNHADRSTHR